ncbi:MAG: hypothetical protein WCV81_02445 [Microgenomates group bacterium]|jgi:hypothetical protein
MISELLVPRKPITFTPLEEGRFIALSNDVPDVLKQPMIRSEGGLLKGYESGWRSGLIKSENQLYKIKSCRPVGGKRGNQPRGSHVLSSAQFEADDMLERREVFLKNGFDYPLEPIGIWVYDHVKFNGESNAATLYRAKGDTRLDELIWWVERSPYEYASSEYASQLSYAFDELGYQTGKRLKSFHENNFSWDSSPVTKASNAHLGNIVIFPTDSGAAEVGMVDFDISIGYLDGDPKELQETVKIIQKNDLTRFCYWMNTSEVVSRARRIKYFHPFVAGKIVDCVINQNIPDLDWEEEIETIGMAGGYLLRALNPCEDIDNLKKEIWLGFKSGYKGSNIESEESQKMSITWDELARILGQANKIRRNFIKRLKEEIGPDADRNRIKELALFYDRRISQHTQKTFG